MIIQKIYNSLFKGNKGVAGGNIIGNGGPATLGGGQQSNISITTKGNVGILTNQPPTVLTIPAYSSSYSGSMSGSYTISNPKVLVLAGDRNSFDTFLALGDGVNRKKFDYVFCENAADLDSVDISLLKILDDFCLHPKIIEILGRINKGDNLYFNSRMK